MQSSLSYQLQQRHAHTWHQALTHPFVQHMCQGSAPRSQMAAYLVQDHRFVDSFLALIGAGIASADTLEPRLRLARFAGEIAGEENTYFLRAFQALGVDAQQRNETPDVPATAQFKTLFAEAEQTRQYAAILAVLVVAEGLYLDWASRAGQPGPNDFIFAEWISLHDNPGFRDLVAFLRAELDRVGPGSAELVDEFFGRAIETELAFFEQAPYSLSSNASEAISGGR